ncbi:MAG: diguanylate cyclase [Treponema sp.]|jgi:diguanylate cyclase (GGDEF)-like protein|nr:diguanylate cyclase [Treponema sp.]
MRGLTDTLKENILFTDLSDAELDTLAAELTELRCRKGDVIYRRGGEGNAVYAVLEGAAGTTGLGPKGEAYPADVFPAGACAGGLDFLDRSPHGASCIALEDCRLVSLSRDNFDSLINLHGEIAAKIMSRMAGVISGRIAAAGLMASELARWGEDACKRAIADDVTGLFNLQVFDEIFPVRIARAKIEGKPLSLVIAALDHGLASAKHSGGAFPAEALAACSALFKKVFLSNDVLFRFGSERFAFLLPDTNAGTALKLCNAMAGKVRYITFPEHPDAVITLSIGIASAPEHAETAEGLKDAADKAQAAAKEAGGDRAIIARKPAGRADNPYKTEIRTIAEKRRISNRIIGEIFARDSFLLLGHKNPDADCSASLVAFALLLDKFGKDVTIFLPEPVIEQLSYLLAICKYNNIAVVRSMDTDFRGKFSTLVILDTPNADMLMKNDSISELFADPSIRKIELDHHLGSNSRYTGDRGYCLISQASSTGELIGYLCMKMAARLHAKDQDGITGFFSRNLALAILTGIVGDSQMGRFLKSSRERWYYHIFSSIFEHMLAQTTKLGSKNLASMLDIYNLIQNLSDQESACYKEMTRDLQTAPAVHAATLDREKSEELFRRYDNEIIVNVSKYAADRLSEDSGKMGLSAYYDDPSLSDFIQFRLRRSTSFTGFDLRTVLTALNITNGGGHPGAIGFRIPKNEIPDLHGYTEELLARIGRMLGSDRE